jgi:hypothetical protein
MQTYRTGGVMHLSFRTQAFDCCHSADFSERKKEALRNSSDLLTTANITIRRDAGHFQQHFATGYLLITIKHKPK